MKQLFNKIKEYPYIIAEIGCNHNGDLKLARRMIFEAKKCGCNAVKFQLWQKDELATKNYLRSLNTGKIKLENVSRWKTPEHNLKDIFQQVEKYSLSYDAHKKLFAYARKIGIDYSSTPITEEGVDFLNSQKAAFIKISSMDANNLDLIEYTFKKTKIPVVISLGLADEEEIKNVISLIPKSRISETALLHCISLYPPRDHILNLNYIKRLSSIYKGPVGYSDHTLGTLMPLAAISIGARVIEKHFTLDKNLPGWDHKVSADPKEMREICEGARRIIKALGSDGERVLSRWEILKRNKFRRSATTIRPLEKGHILSPEDIVFKRPGHGISPEGIKKYYGIPLSHSVSSDHTLKIKDFQKEFKR